MQGSQSVITFLMCVANSANIWACGITESPPPATPTPTSTQAPPTTETPRPEPESDGKQFPSEVLDLDDWNLTLPSGRRGSPETVDQPELATFRSTHFQLTPAGDAVVFSAPAGGTTTKNSSYPRSELREMNGRKKASWSNARGVHTLTARQAVTALPPVKPEVVTAQIHDSRDDVMQVRLEGPRLIVLYDDGDREIVIDPNYRLGAVFDLKIVAADRRVQVYYNGVRKADMKLSGSGWYFKSGSYLQSNTGKGDRASAVGDVVIYSLDVSHTG